MQFRLTYSGTLRSNQKDALPGRPDKLASHKHDLRRVFHEQLKRLWQMDPFLSTQRVHASGTPNLPPSRMIGALGGIYTEYPYSLAEYSAQQFLENGYRFLPLVRKEWELLCELDILFLRRDPPGSGVIDAGDLDNRIKTLIDGLRKPKSPEELAGNKVPLAGEDPFYCLLEDDSLVSAISVRAGTLLDPDDPNDDKRVRLVIRCR